MTKHKIGTTESVFVQNSKINKYILMSIFEKINLSIDIKHIQDDFLIKIHPNVNMLTIKTEEKMLTIDLILNDKNKIFLVPKIVHTFFIDYKDFMVYSSEDMRIYI